MNQPPASSASNASGRSTLRFDIVSGLTASAVVLPKAMAYATVAGLSVAVVCIPASSRW
jgi:MFS superfamily sulfate permease-like transporter